MACDVDFSPLDNRVMVVTGKEHLGWWQLDTDNRVIQLYRKPEYLVSVEYCKIVLFTVQFFSFFLFDSCFPYSGLFILKGQLRKKVTV